jgi:hypothetical protein
MNAAKVLVVDGPALGEVWDEPKDRQFILYAIPPDPPPVWDYWKDEGAAVQFTPETVTYYVLRITVFGRVVNVMSCDRAVIAGRAQPDINNLWDLLVSEKAKACAEPVPPPAFGNGARR